VDMSVQYRVSMDKRKDFNFNLLPSKQVVKVQRSVRVGGVRSGCDKPGIKLNARRTKKIEEALKNG